ncbi:MAG: hypothetical protein K2Q13_11345, partial [Nitrosomonas sp.]|uniref:hypothetical protein n=1 Tax=Nitrosomonas sp. TaxID=42353 RepID=UPI0025F48D67
KYSVGINARFPLKIWVKLSNQVRPPLANALIELMMFLDALPLVTRTNSISQTSGYPDQRRWPRVAGVTTDL